eukprot:CAMPEP_0174233940 /NCGR_PEP_ID=MMETSP0417-20130205/3846_1 /TAXON_ID=242541 /ORGANISM="Mayorella sp, Strain BSH-02190019" /LENGTH=392 /DNA_ID=CAMNT_0015312237 /DNA_START=103 /DNA_END=1278 /DNA_ORIENTATION=-
MSRFFKGVSLEQDRRFTNKDQKLAKKVNFPTELDQVIDIKNKVKFEVLRPWITRTTIELLGLEDDVFITYVIELLQKNEEARPRELHVSVTPFLGLENASKFCEELWKLLISAQQSEFGIPSQFLEARKAQLAQQQAIALARQRELDALRNKVTVELAARQAQRLQQEHTTAPSVALHQPQQAQPKQARPPGPPPARVQVSSADVGAAPAVAPSSRGSDAASLPNMASLIASTQVASSGWDAPTGVIMRADREERRKRRREQQEQRRRGHDGDQEDAAAGAGRGMPSGAVIVPAAVTGDTIMVVLTVDTALALVLLIVAATNTAPAPPLVHPAVTDVVIAVAVAVATRITAMKTSLDITATSRIVVVESTRKPMIRRSLARRTHIEPHRALR